MDKKKTSAGRDRPVPLDIDTSPEAIMALPGLDELGVPSEIVEAVEELFAGADGPGVEPYRISLAVRLIVSQLQLASPGQPGPAETAQAKARWQEE